MNKIEVTVGTFLLITSLSCNGNSTSDPYETNHQFQINSPNVEYFQRSVAGNSTFETPDEEELSKFDSILNFASDIISNSFSLEPEVLEMVDELLFDLI